MAHGLYRAVSHVPCGSSIGLRVGLCYRFAGITPFRRTHLLSGTSIKKKYLSERKLMTPRYVDFSVQSSYSDRLYTAFLVIFSLQPLLIVSRHLQGVIFRNVAMNEVIVMNCLDHFVVNYGADSMVTCRPSVEITCRADGTLTPTTRDLQCTAVKCLTTGIDESNGVIQSNPAIDTSSGTMLSSASTPAQVQCNQNYKYKPEGYSGTYASCTHNAFFSNECSFETCTFDTTKMCTPTGCDALTNAQKLTKDGLKDVVFKDVNGNVLIGMGNGLVKHNDVVNMECPVGYRIDTDATLNAANASWPRSASRTCGTDCILPGVVCKRLSCGAFTIPSDSMGSMQDGTTYATGTEILHGEVLTLLCITNFRFPTSCDTRNISLMCNDDGKFVYTGGFSSALAPSSMTCVAAACSIESVSELNGHPEPSTGFKQFGQSLTVS